MTMRHSGLGPHTPTTTQDTRQGSLQPVMSFSLQEDQYQFRNNSRLAGLRSRQVHNLLPVPLTKTVCPALH